MNDPIGSQKKIKSDEEHVSMQKLLDGGGAKSKYVGQRNMESGTKDAKFSTSWQGKTKGKTTHTYKADL